MQPPGQRVSGHSRFFENTGLQRNDLPSAEARGMRTAELRNCGTAELKILTQARQSAIVGDTVKRISARAAAAIAGVAVTGLFILLIALFVRVGRVDSRIDGLTVGLSTELETQNRLATQLESNQRQVTRHLAEVRQLLNLSPGSYRFPEESIGNAGAGTSVADDENEGTEAGGRDGVSRGNGDADAGGEVEAFFDAIERIQAEERLEQLEARLAAALPEHVAPALPAGMRLRSAGRFRWEAVPEPGYGGPLAVGSNPDAPPPLSLFASLERWTIRPAAGDTATIVLSETTVDPADPAVLRRLATTSVEMLSALEERVLLFNEAVSTVRTTLATPATEEALEAAQLVTGNEDRSFLHFRVPFLTAWTGDEAFSAVVAGAPPTITIGDATYAAGTTEGRDTAREELLDRIRRTDPRTAAQRATETAIDRVQAIAADAGFQRYLAQRDLSLTTDMRESIDFFYFDIVNVDGERFGSFAVQKQLGEVYIANAQDVIITTLARAGDPALPAPPAPSHAVDASGLGRSRGLPDAFPPGFRGGRVETEGTNILLVGTHEQKADAMIMAHLSPEKTVSMVSIPRDLWWQGRKLGYHAQVYGMEHLVDQVEAITGQTIDGWISVDMYAFIEVVDLLGGIEVTLAEPLIDPTYRVREAGSWSTLYYDAGTHHLGGVEALRLARSRHTSNDFERAQRQQMILSALRGRLNALNAGDLDRVYELLETLNTYVDTSYSVWELAQFYLGYRNAEIANRTGLTFDNVLYNTWSNLYLQGLERGEVEDDFYLGAWILLPREDNWDVVRWFVEENIR